MVVPRKHPKMIIFSRKTHGFVGETHHFRKPQYNNIHFSITFFTRFSSLHSFQQAQAESWVFLRFPLVKDNNAGQATYMFWNTFLEDPWGLHFRCVPSWIFTPQQINACALFQREIHPIMDFRKHVFQGIELGKQCHFVERICLLKFPGLRHPGSSLVHSP